MTKKMAMRAVLAITAALMLLPLPLLAEGGEATEASPPAQEEQAPPAAQQQPEVPEVSDRQLSKFTDCYLRIMEIRQRYDGLLANVESPAEAEAIQQRAVAEMTQAITAGGLDVDSYNNIGAAIAQDPEVSARFHTMLEARQGD